MKTKSELFYDKFVKRKLEERSYLSLDFPTEKGRTLRAQIPFLENPIISESGNARYDEYSLIGRAGNLFSYMGAESRQISLSFNINLLHLYHITTREGLASRFLQNFKLFFDNKDKQRMMFSLKTESDLRWLDPGDISKSNIGGVFDIYEHTMGNGIMTPERLLDANEVRMERDPVNHAKIHRDYYRSLINYVVDTPAFDEFSDFFTKSLEASVESLNTKVIDDTINLLYFWLNLIRGTVLNNSKNSAYGPPTVRLTHGPMYNNIPCLVESYNVKIVENAGYDVGTLTPHVINISLKLKENRVGDLSDYVCGGLTSGDNLAGWEAIYERNTNDPYNGTIRSL